MAASVILEFLYHHIKTIKASVVGHINVSDFVSSWYILLKMWVFDFFCRFGLKCLFMPPKFRFWREFASLNMIGYHKDPKRHIGTRSHVF